MAGTRNNANLANQPTFFETLHTRVRGRGCIFRKKVGWLARLAERKQTNALFPLHHTFRFGSAKAVRTKSAGGFAYMK